MNLIGLYLLVGGYLLGSLPFGYLIGRSYGVDIRTKGSGNIGAANILRVIGKGPALATLLLDTVKGFLPTLLARQTCLLPPGWIVAVGLSVIIGHTFSVFLNFKGGKGVATSLGVLIGLSPLTALFILLVWLAIFAVSRIISLASMAAALSLPPLLWCLAGRQPVFLAFGILITALVFLAHRKNIGRLFSGQEPKVTWKK
ncbi:MAG: glycerol-3-phosphate 1-O-acyltransferase PlsY [Candidatus Omnitrophica bacterium]|nr:glycerol-3-phosphate 1-O-acyltransferase PlsY [Candidatus Omnitrophota bacterium]